MPYTLPSWQNSPTTGSPLNAANLNFLNNAITDLDSRATYLNSQASAGLDQVQAVASTAVPIYPTDNAQTVVNAHPAGTTFLIKAGMHSGFTLNLTTPGLYNGMRFIGEPGAILDGGNANLQCLTAYARDLVFRGWSASQPMQINNYTPTATQSTVVNCNNQNDSRFSLPGCEIAYLSLLNNAQVNVRGGASSYLHDLTITNAGMNSLAGAGIGSPLRPCVVRNITITNNNTSGSAPGFEGGIKFATCRYVEVSNVTIVGNPNHSLAWDSYGLWFDVNCENIIVHDCTISDTPRAGLVAEIGGAFQFYNNTITNCGFAWDGIGQGSAVPQAGWGFGGGAGIMIASSGNNTIGGTGGYISRNTITNCNEGIVVREQNRGVFNSDKLTPLFSTNIHVVSNTLNSCGGTGVVTDIKQWSSTKNYALYDQIYSNNMLFTSMIASNLNNAPPSTPTSSAQWQYSAMQPADPSRRMLWNLNTYTGQCGPASHSFSPSAFYWTAGTLGHASTMATWQGFGQDINGSYS